MSDQPATPDDLATPQPREQFGYETDAYLRDDLGRHWRIVEILWNYTKTSPFPDDRREYVLVSVDHDTLGDRRRRSEQELDTHYRPMSETEVRGAIRPD